MPLLHLSAGSQSLQSIPSSPTSIRSSSSAIFELDIEPLAHSPVPAPHHSPNPHRTPRSRNTESIE
ncbi:hypothetical protein M422DRAFT_255056 [Sphaerobolus stellatus SS14]|uniref:Uncharacterized protein n=1 Tax=Sphaerobolus stellatus (strain SS14) TaxID=990650 RepID=A0A0C9VU65_SPHS4|nr:hypothetical protein M422DRAFT_255056 [Sphaerobolus stellatus SS14]